MTTDKTKRKIEAMLNQAAEAVEICVWDQLSDATKNSVDDYSLQPIVQSILLQPGFRFVQTMRETIRLKLDEYDYSFE